MPFYIDTGSRPRLSLGVADSIAELQPEEQCDLICRELEKPKRADTIRRKLKTYWPAIAAWPEDQNELFDRVIYTAVDELEQRNAIGG